MVISWEFAQGLGAQFAFFVLGSHYLGHRLALRTFFSFCRDLCIAEGGGKKTRKGKGKENKIKQSKKVSPSE